MRKIFTLVMLCCAALFTQAQCAQFLNFDTSVCTGGVSKTIDATVLKTQLCGDSITILFSSAGTNLDGDTNVYFHSGPEFRPFEGWQGSYTVGNYGQNDGVGRMTKVGTNLWSIRINPRTYYNYSVDSCLNGIFMVFRNFDGSKEVQDGSNNIYLYTSPGTPSSTYVPIQGSTETHNNNVSYLWSDGRTDSVRTFTASTNLTVTATGVGGCTATGSVRIRTAHPRVNLGADIVRCDASTVTTLNAGSGFTTYKWLDGAANINPTYTARNPGCYWILAIDSANCTSTDTISIHNSEVAGLNIPDSLGTCPGGHISVNAATSVNLQGDSVVIIYNATLGQTGLVNSPKVYMHSGPEFHPFQGWQTAYTVGNYGQDNGVGQMTSLGNNLWRIAIDPYCYYNINPDTSLNGIFMIFRNADGSLTGKDSVGGDIFVLLTATPPTSSSSAVAPSRTARLPLTYTWSNSVTGPTNTFTAAGLYIVTVADNNGCSKSDSIRALFTGGLSITLGNDTTICHGNSITLTGPAGFAHYAWSNAATTSSITVSTAGTYTLTVSDTSGCQSTASRRVSISTTQVNLGADIVRCTRGPVTITANTGFRTYQWLNAAPGTSNTYTGTKTGPYWIKATDSAGCVSYDTVNLHYSDVLGLTLTDSTSACPGSNVPLDANTSIEANGDSIVIIYDATTGVTGLTNAAKVYFHSGPEFYAGQGWEGAYTVGNYGQDDGVGKMDSLGNNHWRIAIDPHTYYHVNPDTPITGIYMIFRNADGSATGKDSNGGNIYVSLTNNVTPVSHFFGVTAFRASGGNISYLWSNGTPAASTFVTTTGTYTVTVTDNHSCTSTAAEYVSFTSNLTTSLGRDTTICSGSTLTLAPTGAGYTNYHWSTGDSTATISVSTSGTYAVTVSNGSCSASAHVAVTVHTHLIALGADIVRCTTAPVTLTAPTGFAAYHWFGTVASTRTYSAVHAGTYWLQAVDSSGCISYDSLTVTNSSVLGLLLPDSSVSCGGDTVRVNAATSINANGDSLTIVYDATKGQSGLVGSAKVYMHSGPQFAVGGGWQGTYTVGNYGQDDGIGQMTALGGNKWTITIDPRTYYHLNPDTALTGVYMIFRNADGSATGKDDNGNDILLSLNGNAPTSTFNGVTGSFKAAGPLTYLWSTGATTSAAYFTSGGVYTVTVADTHSCSKADNTTVFQGQSPNIHLGNDTSACGTYLITLNAGSGFSQYVWNTGASTPTIFVTMAGTYAVTVTNSVGCTGKDTLVVSAGQGSPIFIGDDTATCRPVLINAGAGYTSYSWSTGATTSSITATTPGSYIVAVTNSLGCISRDTLIITSGQAAVVTLGHDTNACNPVILHAALGYASYIWNTGASTSSITVTAPGHYSITVTNNSGCSGTASVLVDSCNSVVVVGCGSPVANFSIASISPGNTVTFRDNSLINKMRSYEWEFGDGTSSNDTGSVVHTYGATGIYTVTLVVRDSCGGVDSTTRTVNVNTVGITTISGLISLNLYPNPNNGNFNVEVSLQAAQTITFNLMNQLGQVVLSRKTELTSGRTIVSFDAANYATGIYTLQLLSNNEMAIKKITIAR